MLGNLIVGSVFVIVLRKSSLCLYTDLFIWDTECRIKVGGSGESLGEAEKYVLSFSNENM